MLFKILFYIFVYRTARSGSYNLKQITQMESVNYNELATLVLALCCIVTILTFGVVYAIARIGQIQKDFLREDEEIYNHVAVVRKNLVDKFLALDGRIRIEEEKIFNFINQPLYEVGNTVWYNRGITGEPGVHEEYKGKIIGIVENPCAEPEYLVDSNEGKGFTISQRIITAWTN